MTRLAYDVTVMNLLGGVADWTLRKMANVVSAPLAEFDGRDWHEFHDFALLGTLQEGIDTSGKMYFADRRQIYDNKPSKPFDKNEANRLALFSAVYNDAQKPTLIMGPLTDIDMECNRFSTNANTDLAESGAVTEAGTTICRCFGTNEQRTESLASIQITNSEHHLNDSP